MSLLDSRSSTADAIIQGRFIRMVSEDVVKDIDEAQKKYMSSRGFESNEWYSRRNFKASDEGVEYEHLKVHRFVDMKFRNSKNGRSRRKSHQIHNKILWEFYNSFIKQMHFGLTESVKHKLRLIED